MRNRDFENPSASIARPAASAAGEDRPIGSATDLTLPVLCEVCPCLSACKAVLQYTQGGHSCSPGSTVQPPGDLGLALPGTSTSLHCCAWAIGRARGIERTRMGTRSAWTQPAARRLFWHMTG